MKRRDHPGSTLCAVCLRPIVAKWRRHPDGDELRLEDKDGSLHRCTDGTRTADAGDGASPRRSTGHNEEKGE